MISLLLKQALDQAAVWHKHQFRKYPQIEVPYMSHLAGVGILLAQHHFQEEVIVAGVLHDCMEDAGISFEDLTSLFGIRVATLVQHVSEPDKSLSWEERKQQYLEYFPKKPWEAQAISLADKLDNFRSILVCAKLYGNPWGMFKRGKEAQLHRFQALAEKAKQLQPHPLIDEYLKTLAFIEQV